LGAVRQKSTQQGDLAKSWSRAWLDWPVAAALGCCGLLVHSFVAFNFHIPANAAWFAVCMALATP
jgi:hypothetical protein